MLGSGGMVDWRVLERALDHAVWAAYGWDDAKPAQTSDEAMLERLLALNLARAGSVAGDHG